MPFSTSLEVITEESSNCLRDNDNKTVEFNKEADAISRRSFLLLQQKDEELKMLQMKVRNLELMSAEFENRKSKSESNSIRNEETFHIDESLLSKKAGDNEKIKDTSAMKRRSWQFLQNIGVGDGLSCLNQNEIENSKMAESIQNNNLQLKKELLSESRMRMQDRKKIIEVLDQVHKALKNVRTHPDISPCQEFVDLATKWFEREINCSDVTDDILGNREAENMDEESFEMRGALGLLDDTDNRKSILKSMSSTTREVYENGDSPTNLEKLATSVDSMMDEQLVSKLDAIKSDLGGLQLMVQNSQDRVTQERRIQQVAQAAWRARFDIQLRTIKRLETRYQKVCRCLMKFRRRVQKDQKPEKKTRIKKNKKNPSSSTLEDDLIANIKEKCQKNNFKEQNQPNLKTSEGNAFLQGKFRLAGIVLAQNKKLIDELSSDKKALEKEIDDLKQELLKVSSKKVAMSFLSETDGKPNSSLTLNKNAALVEKCVLLSNEIIALKDELELSQIEVNVLKDEKNCLFEEKKALEINMGRASDRLNEMEEISNQKLAIEKRKVHAYEQKFSEFYKQSGLHVQEARDRITTANKKLREFFKMVQIFLEKVNEQQFSKSAPLTGAYQIASSFLNLSHKDLQLLRESSQDNYNKWTSHCRTLAKHENFAEEMADFLFNLATDKNSFEPEELSINDVEVGSLTF